MLHQKKQKKTGGAMSARELYNMMVYWTITCLVT